MNHGYDHEFSRILNCSPQGSIGKGRKMFMFAMVLHGFLVKDSHDTSITAHKEICSDYRDTRCLVVCSGDNAELRYEKEITDDFLAVNWYHIYENRKDHIAHYVGFGNLSKFGNDRLRLLEKETLEITNTQSGDSGIYYREVVTEVTLNSSITLNVLEPPTWPPKFSCSNTNGTKICNCSLKYFGKPPVTFNNKIIKNRQTDEVLYDCCLEGQALKCLEEKSLVQPCHRNVFQKSKQNSHCRNSCIKMASIFIFCEVLVVILLCGVFCTNISLQDMRKDIKQKKTPIKFLKLVFAVFIVLSTPAFLVSIVFVVCDESEDCRSTPYRILFGCGFSIFPIVLSALMIANIVPMKIRKTNGQQDRPVSNTLAEEEQEDTPMFNMSAE